MDQGVAVAVLLVAVVVLTPLSDRINVPQPVALTVFGLLLALVPGFPEIEIPADIILPLVLPPLLFAATQRTTAREFREHAGAVSFLAVGLTVASAGAAAVVAHALGLGWPSSFVLGAIVSPPDPVAATAVARKLSLPHRLVTILEGEGMFNDATALVLYQVAVAAAVSGAVSYGGAGLSLLLAVVAGLAVGLVVGVVTRTALARIHDGYAETTLTVLAPFVAYIAAEEVHGSGVLAVLALGLYLRSYGHQATTSQGWLLGRAVWSYADFIVTSLVFAVLGFELLAVVRELPVSHQTEVTAVAVVATLVVLRTGWVFVGSLFAARRARRRDLPLPSGWRESTVVSWAGMRGVVTVATALALPATLRDGSPFDGRDEVVVVALVTVLATLVVQGITLAPLTTFLRVGVESDEAKDVAGLRQRAAQAAYDEICSHPPAGLSPEVHRAARLQYEGYLAAQSAMEEARETVRDDEEVTPAEELREALQRATDTERTFVLHARTHGEVSAGVADEVLRDIEGRALRDF